MSEDIKHFLVVYDVGRQLADVSEFGHDQDAALEAYGEREREFRFDPQIEVVLLGADSLATVKKTHSSYFLNADEDPLLEHLRSRGLLRG